MSETRLSSTGRIAALPWFFMWRHLRDRPDLLEPQFGAAYAQTELRRASIGPLVYAVAIPLALVLPLAALLFYIAIAVLYGVTNQGVTIPGVDGTAADAPKG